MNYLSNLNLLAFTFVCIMLLNLVNSKGKEPLRLCSQRDVCRTSLKYKDGTVADEGLLCKCSEDDNANNEGESEMCPPDWIEDDGRVMTWQHYERFFNMEHVCEKDELAALVKTDIKSWHPHVSSPRCTCHEDYKMMGWKRESGMWQYRYECTKAECSDPANPTAEASICARIYVDTYRKSDMVNEMKFLCNCPKNYMCDAKFDEKEDLKNTYSDDIGKYVIKMCEKIVKKKSS